MAGTNVDLAPEATPGLHLMSLYAFERLRQLLAGRPEGKPRLTRREREVLAWSRKESPPGSRRDSFRRQTNGR
jgi:LuxR family quorum sensing-dependent transcriptional regulator